MACISSTNDTSFLGYVPLKGKENETVLVDPPPSPKSLCFRGTNFLRSADPYGGGSKCVCDTSVVVVESREEVFDIGAYSLTGCGRLDSRLAMLECGERQDCFVSMC